jgi:hypothetical protein
VRDSRSSGATIAAMPASRYPIFAYLITTPGTVAPG